jgi:hypothetical protein
VLTSRTRGTSLNASLPIRSLLDAGSNGWIWPQVNYSWQRVRQFGVGIPVNGEFAASHIPDQVSTNQSATAAWSRGAWNLVYRWNRSWQDNRQSGRELADFRGMVHSLALGLTPSAAFSGALDLSLERHTSIEAEATQRVERMGVSLQWQVTRTTSLSSALSQMWGRDPILGQRTRHTEWHAELSQGFTLYRKTESGTQGRVFVRFARSRASVGGFEPVSLATTRISWVLNAGGSLRLC